MPTRILRVCLATAVSSGALLLLVQRVGFAQFARAALSITVIDQDDAVVTGASVVAFNTATGLERRATTDGEGRLVIPVLPAGRYNVTVQREGFKTVDIRNVHVESDGQASLRVRLAVGNVSEFVVVMANATDGIERDDQSVSVATAFGPQRFENYPLNGRTPQSLINLVPGTVVTKTNFNEQGQFSVNGQRPNANYFTVDGVSANFGVSAGPAPGQGAAGSLPALSSFGGMNNLVSADGVQELRIKTSTYAAEFGRMPGAQVAFSTRAGTDEFRGAVFYNLRRRALDASDWFVNAGGLTKPPSRHDNFGGAIGGPIARNRTHFFFTYEWLDVTQPRVASSAVPAKVFRDFGPAELLPLFNAFPQPLANAREVGFGMSEFSASYGEPSSLSAAALRIDHVVNRKLSFFGRFAQSPSRTVQRGQINPPTSTARLTAFRVTQQFRQSLSTVNESEFETRTFTLSSTYTRGPGVTADFRLNWSQAEGSTFYRLDDFGGAIVPPSSYFFPPFASPQDGLVQIVFLQPVGQAGNLRMGKDADNRNRQLNFVGTVGITRGSHQFRIGVDYRRLTSSFGAPAYTQTDTFFSLDLTPPPPTVFFSALSGTTFAQIFKEADPRQPLFQNVSVFAQDSWRVRRRLTLSYGVRWELSPPPRETTGRHPAVMSDALDLRMGMVPARLNLAPDGTPLWKTTYFNFAPRVGIAYQPARWSGTTLRAGFGIYYDLGNGPAAQAFGSVFPYTTGRSAGQVQFPLRPVDAQPLAPGVTPSHSTLYVFDPELKLPYTRQWNITVEKEINPNHTLSLSYIGAQGRRLLREDVFFFAPAFLPEAVPDRTIVMTTGSASSDYRALQAQVGRRLVRGFEGFVSYTWSSSVDTASDETSLWFVNQFAPDPGLDEGPSDFDVRHSVTAGLTYTVPRLLRTGLGEALARRWSIDAIVRWRSATPINVGNSVSILSGAVVQPGRPRVRTGIPLYLRDAQAPGGLVVNSDAFTTGGSGTEPLGRNALRGFGASQLDIALRREFALSDRLRFQLRAEIYNLLNHPNFANPTPIYTGINQSGGAYPPSFVSTQTLGQSLGTGGAIGGLIPIYQIGGARSVQLGLKLRF